jgi:hypothetical protein
LVESGPHLEAATILQGASNVIIEGQAAARLGDALDHGGRIRTGFYSVLIGDNAQTATLRRASASGAPFCEECERAKAKRAVLAGPIVTGAKSVFIGYERAARVTDTAPCHAMGAAPEEGTHATR